MAKTPCEHDAGAPLIVTFSNTSAVTISTSGANVTLSQSGSADLSKYNYVGLASVVLAGSSSTSLAVRGFNPTTKEIYIVNTGSQVTLNAGYIQMSFVYLPK